MRRLFLATLAALAFGSSTASASTAVSWGQNLAYNLGAGYYSNFQDLPVSVLGLTGVKQLAAGAGGTFALLEDGEEYGWGGNQGGQIGNGTRVEARRPVKVPLSGVTQVVAADEHTAALLSNGTVMSWGGNDFAGVGNGQTGHGKESSGSFVLHPVALKLAGPAVSIANGGADGAAVLANGTVEAWGENQFGQVGDGTSGKAGEKPSPVPVKGLAGVKQIALGGNATIFGHALALLSNGTVEAWGKDAEGESGPTASTTPILVPGLVGVKEVAAGTNFSIVLLQNGTVETFGEDGQGQLGYPAPEKCGAAKQSFPCSKLPRLVPGLAGITEVSAGGGFAMARTATGGVLTWGQNAEGQLGNGSTTSTDVPQHVLGDVTAVSAGNQHAAAVYSGTPIPELLEAVPGPTSIMLGWRLHTSQGWRVIYRPDLTKAKPVQVPLPSGTSSYTITGLAPGTAYRVDLVTKGSKPWSVIATPSVGVRPRHPKAHY